MVTLYWNVLNTTDVCTLRWFLVYYVNVTSDFFFKERLVSLKPWFYRPGFIARGPKGVTAAQVCEAVDGGCP